jgi:hypothetical protein
MIRGICIQTHRAPLFWLPGIEGGAHAYIQTHRQLGDLISILLSFKNKRNRLKIQFP